MSTGVIAYPRLLSCLLLLLCGAIALPMLPIWQGGIRLLACIALLCIARYPLWINRLIGITFAFCLIANLVFWCESLLSDPGKHVIASLTDVFGQPLGVGPDLLLLIIDIICITSLFFLIQRAKADAERLTIFFCVGLVVFWFSGLFTTASVSVAAEPSQLSQMMTGLSGWATWLYWAFLAILLVRDESALLAVLRAIALGCAVCWVSGVTSMVSWRFFLFNRKRCRK